MIKKTPKGKKMIEVKKKMMMEEKQMMKKKKMMGEKEMKKKHLTGAMRSGAVYVSTKKPNKLKVKSKK